MFTNKNLFILIGRHVLIALVVVGIAGAVVFFFARKIEKISTTVVINRNLATSLEKRTGVFTTLKRDTEIVGTNDTFIEGAFLPADNILAFISTLESLALKNGITQTFNFDSPTPANIDTPLPLLQITYTNNIPSNVFAFSNYLKDFEKLPYFTKIESLNITAQSPTGWSSTSNASFRAILYTKAIQ
ncbi:MAG: hypothetical protein UY07_C0002G0042 [Parcubacteria group bacterium GW2011_GWA1_47_8]|nr:MAG: hypothetical protein UY07_C0002G0042 [Parcubacteria group bacterium GW2011_GWA1_47_8]